MKADRTILPSDEIHVWRVSLDLKKSQMEPLEKILSEDELAKANRFRFPRDRNHYIVGRGVLRTILSGYTQIFPQELRFLYESHGKPELATAGIANSLCFNLSHSHGMALIGVTQGHKIGIDLERISYEINPFEISEHFFSIQERTEMKALPPELLHDGFFTCWTRKEAYLKGSGLGLSAVLQEFSVILDPRKPAQLLHDNTDPEAVNRWFFYPVRAWSNYKAALVVKAPGCHVKHLDWEPSP